MYRAVGQFRIVRYRMDRDNLVHKIETLGAEHKEKSLREKLISRVASEPGLPWQITQFRRIEHQIHFQGDGSRIDTY